MPEENNTPQIQIRPADIKDIGETLKNELNAPNVFVITDKNLKSLYPELLGNAYAIEPGESSKTLSVAEKVMREMLMCGCNRSTTVIAVGGGVVGDIAGFCAAVFMRGVNWVNIPTSLLAMADSAIGGKTGVNLDEKKNIIGAFWSPQRIIVSTHWLKTLPDREWACGFGEIIKTCMLDQKIFEFLNANLEGMINRDKRIIEQLVNICGQVKMAIVKDDFKESGKRRILNVGHTVAHALETLDGYKLTHGEYVMKGILAELKMFKDRVDSSYLYTINSWVSSVMQDTTLGYGAEVIANIALCDKKNLNAGKIVVMIPIKPGTVTAVELDEQEFIKRLSNI